MNMFDFFHPKMDVQLNMPPETPRDIDSEIDWKIIDQLHNAVLNFSRNSMQAKKIMFSILGIFVAAMLQKDYVSEIINWLLVIDVIVFLFWSFDAQTYYYQEKLRAKIDTRLVRLKTRHNGVFDDDELTLPDDRQNSNEKMRIWRSFINGSVLFYPAIIVIILVCWAAGTILIHYGLIS